MAMATESAAALVTLVRLHDTHAAADPSQYSEQRDKETRTKAFGLIVSTAALATDGLKVALQSCLRAELATGRSLYSTEQRFHSIVIAVFWGLSGSVEPEQAEKLRASVFVTVLQLLHSSNSATIAQRVVMVLLKELHNLRIVDLASAVAEVLRGVSTSHRLQQRGDTLAIFHTIELLPQLLLRVSLSMTLSFEVSQADSVLGDLSGPEYRQHILSKLASFTWPRRFFLQVMKNFRDFSLSQDEERVFCIKIFREARAELVNASDKARALELFPIVCLNVLQLVGRTQNALCQRLLTRLLIIKWQQLADDTTDRSDDSSGLRGGTADLSHRELRELQSTVLYHVDTAMRQWDRLGKSILIEYEQRAPLHKLSKFDIAMLLLVASHTKHESTSMNFLLRYIVDTYSIEVSNEAGSGQAALSRRAFILVVQHAHEGAWTPIIRQIIALSFTLIEHKPPKSVDLDDGALLPSARSPSMTSARIDYGVRLLLAVFQYHPSTRERVLDRVVNMIVVQNADCGTYVLLLARIVKRHIAELGGHELRLRECLEYVTHLTPPLAQRLLVAVSPLLKMQPNLKSFVVMLLRKAMLRKDDQSRIIAIEGFGLLLCLSSRIFSRTRTLSQLYSQNVTRLSQGGGIGLSAVTGAEIDGDIASQEHEHTKVAENLYRQFCGVFRRALELQTEVRLVLYAELIKVFNACPALQQPILTLLFQHYIKFYDSNESVQPPLKLDLSLTRKRGVYEEPLPHLLHTMLHCFVESTVSSREDEEETMMENEEVPATQVGAAMATTDAMQQNIAVLFERLKRCELSDFEFDKQSSFASDSELGETNHRMGYAVLGILQVAMNWTVVQSLHDSQQKRFGSDEVTSGFPSASWEVLLRYAQMHEWIQDRLSRRSDKSASIHPSGSKKRKMTGLSKSKKQAVKSQVRSTDVVDSQEIGRAFEMNASLQWATLLSPSSLLCILEHGCSKARASDGGPPTLTSEEEGLVVTILTRSSPMLELIQAKQQQATLSSEETPHGRRRSSTLLAGRFDETRFLRRLCDSSLALLKLYACNAAVVLTTPMGNKRGSSTSEDGKTTQRRRDLVHVAVQVLARVIEMWMRLPADKCEEELIRALCARRNGDREEGLSPDYDVGGDESEGLALILPPLHQLVDELIAQDLLDDASVLVDITQMVCARVPEASLHDNAAWVKDLLVSRSSQLTARLLEKLVALMLRPHPCGALKYDLTQRVAQGIRQSTNAGADNAKEEAAAIAHATGPPIALRQLTPKHALTIANAILANIEVEMAATERQLKAYDGDQRRQSVKFKEDDLAALHQLEEETGSQVFGKETRGAAHNVAAFKGLCHRLVDVTRSIRPFVLIALENPMASIRIVRLAGRLCKLLTLLVKDKLRRKDVTLPRYVRLLFDRTAADLSPAMLTFISCIHNENQTKFQAGKSSKFIPEVIYQLEQYDLVLIKLSKLCKGHDFSAWCKLRESRDFRLNREQIKRSLDEAGIIKKKKEEDDNDGEANQDASDGEETTTEVPSTADPDVVSVDNDTESADENDEADDGTTTLGKRRQRPSSIEEEAVDDDEGDADEKDDDGEDIDQDSDGAHDEDDDESAMY